MTVLAIAGSLRAASSNAALVRATTGVAVTVCGGLADVPPCSPDADTADPPRPSPGSARKSERQRAC